MKKDFLKAFNLAQSAPTLLGQLLDDQVEASTLLSRAPRAKRAGLSSCIQKRWAQIAELARNLSKEQLEKADTHVQLARMNSLQGIESSASSSLRTALNLDPKNIPALHYSGLRARAEGKLDLERNLLRSIVSHADSNADFELQKLLEESFERYSYLTTSSETLELVEGPWKKLNKSSMTRVRRGLEVTEQIKSPEKMQSIFSEVWGKGEIGDAPEWALYHWANMNLLLGSDEEAVKGFSRYVSKRKTWDESYCKQLYTYLSPADKVKSWTNLRRWTELIMKQECAKKIAELDKLKISTLHLRAIENGAFDKAKPVRDLDEAQKINKDRHELTLFMVEAVLGQIKGVQPESPFGRSSIAFRKARAYLSYLRASGNFEADAGFWNFWLEWRAGNAKSAKASADGVLVELQRGVRFYSEKSRVRYWGLLGDMVIRAGAPREYRARLKHLASEAQVSEVDRKSALALMNSLESK